VNAAPKFEDRRQSASSGFAALMVMVEQTNTNVTSLRTELNEGLASQKQDLQDVLIKAFPEGDADGHRRHHEAVIKAAEDKAKFWEKMRYEITRAGLLGFLLWALSAVWQAALQGPHK
jgi:hypothetical protein